MPYNTRRKSLSLPSLGIQLPPGSRAHQSLPKNEPVSKKVKLAHSPLINTITHEPTPPLSPPPETLINYADINDEIVAGVVSILEATGNRPHTVKELAAVLTPTTVQVETSANPQAIISSRLTNYLRRTHSRSPCLLKKELVTDFHPKRLYYFLTTCPRQPFPKYENEFMRAIVSPAPSDDEDERRREDSPDVDLSSHELGDEEDADDTDNADSLSSTAASVIARDRTRSPSEFNPRNPMASAPLEGDEREFSRSALRLSRRSLSAQSSTDLGLKRSRDEFDTDGDDDDEAAASLLGYQPVSHAPLSTALHVTRVKQEDGCEVSHTNLTVTTDFYNDWNGELERHLESPEAIDLDELDTMLDF